MPLLKTRYRNRKVRRKVARGKKRVAYRRSAKFRIPRSIGRYKVARVPLQQRVRLCTSAVYAVDTVALTYDDAFGINANSCFKPFFLTNAQPAWYDQYARLYNRYAVTSAKVIVKFIPRVDIEGHMMNPRVTIIPTHSATITMTKGGSRAWTTEMIGVREKIVKNDKTSTYVANFSTTNKQLGCKHSLQDLQTSVGSSPSRLWYFHILIEDPMATQPIACDFEVFLYQYVTFFDRNNDLQDA